MIFTYVYLVLMVVTEFYLVIVVVTEFSLVLEVFSEFYLVQVVLTEYYLVLVAFTRLYLVSFVFLWSPSCCWPSGVGRPAFRSTRRRPKTSIDLARHGPVGVSSIGRSGHQSIASGRLSLD